MTGQCAICNGEVIGTRVAYNKQQQLCHCDCLWPDKAKPKPTRTPPSLFPQRQAEGPAKSPMKPASYNPESALKDCKQIAEREYPDVSPEAQCYLVIELMREKYGLLWYAKPMM